MDRMERPTVIAVENETESSASRVTVEGKKITYRMTVLQQPVRARACGQGAKSSADRRPVDPPPIVELKIFEGEDDQNLNDISFTMHANYFLFATLEPARPIAHGRVSSERSSPPVLTGTPVAGMVYLDRPSPAGYFIFPDLSVRHEGKYRLSFSLYEELKNAKDNDKSEDGSKPNPATEPHVTHRLEVKSEPFHVFSAKKFPGLTESTSLSRMVAEQGCRVRIRRDVRMRRPNAKSGGKDWDDYEDETAQARARQSATPDPAGYQAVPQGYVTDHIPRPRSASNASHHSMGTTASRRPSAQDIGQVYGQTQSYSAAPHTPQTGYSQAPTYGPSPTQQYQTSQFVQQQPPMQPPPPQYQAQVYPAPPAPPNPSQQAYYGYASQPQAQPQTQAQSQYGATLPSSYESAQQQQRPSVDYSSHAAEYRRFSAHIPPPPPPAQSSYSQQPGHSLYQPQQSYQHTTQPPAQQSYGSSMDYNSRPAPLEPRTNGAHTPTSTRPNFDLPPINTALIPNGKLEASSPLSAAPPNTSYFNSTHTPVDQHKRSYSNVFGQRHLAEPLRQGARPSTSYSQVDQPIAGAPMSAGDDEENGEAEFDIASMGMHYRRADGRAINRALPSHA